MISDYGTSKVLAVNEIELGMAIPTIKSRVSKISCDEGNTYTGLIESGRQRVDCSVAMGA